MLKRIFIVTIIFVAAIGSSVALAGDSQPKVKVLAFYFHGSFRCVTCTNMEKYSREAIEANFKDALASGDIEFKKVNVEERGNEHFVNNYQLYTKSLILSLVKNGKEIRYKNLDKIWEYSRNKQKFIDYVTGEINGFMKDVR